MKNEQWLHIEDLFHKARELSPEERVTFLDQQCGDDSEVRRKVEALLREDAKTSGLLDGHVVDSLATALSPGTLIGPYEVVGVAGIGGMGQVFRAVDRRLKRDVAVKALPIESTNDRDHLSRLQKEAMVLASVNHENIAAIYDVIERENQPPCLILEFVPGPTLSEKLKTGPLTIEKTVEVGYQIALALEAAHSKGIVHRDLKPSNIKLTPDGKVKVLDFGLARVSRDVRDRESSGTSGLGGLTGSRSDLAGTPSYMSPEQAQGLPVDQRADIWAFGCVLYELLTGRKAFYEATEPGMTKPDLHADPDWALLPQATPAELQRLIRQCLQRDVSKRVGDASVLRTTLERIEEKIRPASRRRAKVRRLSWVALAAAAIIAVAVVALNQEPVNVRVAEPPRQLTFERDLELDPATFPREERLAYVLRQDARFDVVVQWKGGIKNLTKDLPTSVHRWPQWSPDGSLIAFTAGTGTLPLQGPGSAIAAIHVIPWEGGPSTIIKNVSPVGFSWSPGGKELVFAREHAIYGITLDGFVERKIADALDPNGPAWSPDGKWIVYTAGNSVAVFHFATLGNLGPSSISIVSAFGDTQRRFLVPTPGANSSPVWMPDSRSILYVSNGGGASRDIFQLHLSESGEPIGKPVRITTGPALSLHLSADGRQLAYSRFINRANLWSIPVPQTGSVSLSRAKPVTSEVQAIEGVDVSSDGQWIAFDSNRSGNQDIYRMPRFGGKPEQLTTDEHDDFLPNYSPDGKYIAFYSFRREKGRDLFVMNSDGSNQQQITSHEGNEFYPVWSPDGQSLVFMHSPLRGGLQIYVMSRTGDGWGPIRQLTNAEKGAQFPQWSPDAKTIAYLDVARGPALISPDGTNARLLLSGEDAKMSAGYFAWDPDGDTLYFKGAPPNGGYWSIRVSGGKPKRLVRFDDGRNVSRPEFASDGKELFFTITERESDVWVLQLEK
jgi:serine/threonine protein kinase/dipeptidyl aminopeptidase/acylaminoacyl peptidase